LSSNLLCDPSYISALLKRHGFSFSKALGQNFLIDAKIPLRMAKLAGIDDSHVVEIGPGVGCLTAELAKLARDVTAIELDTRLLPVLSETLSAFSNVTVINNDVLKTDFEAICQSFTEDGAPIVACANLPYYLTSPAIETLVESKCFDRLVIMVQKEVARRICSKPGDSDFGAFTLYCQYHSRPELLFTVGSGAYLPRPKVDSAVLKMDILKKPPFEVKSEKAFFALTRAAFKMRRKTLLNALTGLHGLSREEVRSRIERCEINPGLRGETLGVEQFARLSFEF